MIGRLALVLSFAAVAGLAAHRQSSNAVPSARLTLLRELTADLMLAVTNNRTVPLEHIGIQYRTGQGAAGGLWHRTGEPNPPIAPGMTGELRLEDVDGRFDTSSLPEIVLLEFSDGYYEGVADELQRFFADRAERVNDLRYWVDALATMPAGLSNTDAMNYVRRAADAQKAQQPGRFSATASNLLGLGDARRSPGWVAQVLSSKGKDLEAEIRRATRHKERFAQVGTAAPVVAGRSGRGGGTDHARHSAHPRA